MKFSFEHVSPELRELFDRCAHRRTYRADQQIFCEGSDAAFLPIVLSGSAKMIRTPAVGKEIIIGVFREGEMFAIPPVFDGRPYPSSAYAIEETVLMQIERTDFLRLLSESSEFAIAVISWTCEMLREKTAIIRNLAIASPDQRIGNVLVKLAEQQNDPFPVKINARRQDIAEMASLTTETTIRVVRRLADLGLVRVVHGKIILDEVDSLRQFLRA